MDNCRRRPGGMVFPSRASLSVLSKLTPLRAHTRGGVFVCEHRALGHGNGQRGSDRRPVGRRGQGQDRGLAERARRGRGALPGRPQCRPHPGDRQPDLQAGPAAVGRGPPGQAFDHRQRRRGRSLALPGRGREGLGPGRVGDARQPQDRQPCRADPAAAPRPRRLARGRAGHHQDRHDPARHRPGLRGQGRPPRHPGRRSRRAGLPRQEGRDPARPSQCAAPGPGHGRRSIP